MRTSTMTTAEPSPAPLRDPRRDAFLSAASPELFHPVAYRNDIWRPDPFDVEGIHAGARETFERLLRTATTPPGLASGRMLLLLGEAGCGKTHLMRAFRNATHARGLGYCGYMPMTSAVNDYGRYLLGNLIDSLDQPYDEPRGEATGLTRLSTALADTAGADAADLLNRLRDEELTPAELVDVVDALAERVVQDDRFDRVDFDLVRALLFLQRDDARVRGRVLKYLRCEGLTDADRRVLGGLEPRIYDGAPLRLAEKLGGIMRSIDSAALVVCVDQLEDIYNMDEAPLRFRRAIATLCDLISRVPSTIVVIACLNDFYVKVREQLTRPMLDRLEHAPAPIKLAGNLAPDEVVAIVARRLDYLYGEVNLAVDPDRPDTAPIPEGTLRSLAGQRSRDVLIQCQAYRERCQDARILLPFAPGGETPVVEPTPQPTDDLSQLWNDLLTTRTWDVPADDDGQLALMAWAIGRCSDELADGPRFAVEVEPATRPHQPPTLLVTSEGPDGAVDRLVVGLCNRSARGGGLGNQVAALLERSSEADPVVTPVLARSAEFPTNPRAQVSQQIGTLIAQGGRRAVVEDADWRAALALQTFGAEYANRPTFAAWLRRERPLSHRKSLRNILDLDRLPARSAGAPKVNDLAPAVGPEPPSVAPPVRVAVPSPSPVDEAPVVGETSLTLGVSSDRAARPVGLEVGDLVRHAAFLGTSGSGKTTLALNVVERLLLADVPVLLVDRKGDLCGYAERAPWTLSPGAGADAARRAERLRRSVDVALYTPGNPQGRPLAIRLVPDGLGQLPAYERERLARHAANALGAMMNYGNRASDQARLAVLARAIEMLALGVVDAAESPGMDDLVRLIHEKDPALVNAVGLLDPKHFDGLVQDLETLRLSRGNLVGAEGERLSAEALLGLGAHARPGRTRLSIISTKFLGGAADVQFWVAQLLVELARWASRSPSPALQAAALFDEADLYLPATRKPPTKEPMEDLLRRGRSAGLGVLLATQSPGDFDYRCRDQIQSWFVGQVKETTALNKMKPMLADCRIDVTGKLPGQAAGAFHLLRGGDALALRADRNVLPPLQLPEDRILELARGTIDRAGSA